MKEIELMHALLAWGASSTMPSLIFNDDASADEEIEAELYFSMTPWNKLESQQLQKYWNTAILLTSQAFKYFLPGIIVNSIEWKMFNLFHDALLSPLDTGYGRKYLPGTIVNLWSALSESQVNTVIAWIFWLSEQTWFNDLGVDSLLRIGCTLEELKSNSSAS